MVVAEVRTKKKECGRVDFIASVRECSGTFQNLWLLNGCLLFRSCVLCAGGTPPPVHVQSSRLHASVSHSFFRSPSLTLCVFIKAESYYALRVSASTTDGGSAKGRGQCGVEFLCMCVCMLRDNVWGRWGDF